MARPGLVEFVSDKGEPGTAVRTPVVPSNEYPETLLEPSFET